MINLPSPDVLKIFPSCTHSGFLPETFRGIKSIVLFIFLLFSEKILGGQKSLGGGGSNCFSE